MEGEVGLREKGILGLRGLEIAYATDAKGYFFPKEYRSGEA
jgi:hypothetical protein